MLFYEYLHNNDIKVEFKAIDKPECELNDKMDPLKKSLEHEKYVTSLINTIYAAAYEDQEFRTMQMLDWFVKEREKRKRQLPT